MDVSYKEYDPTFDSIFDNPDYGDEPVVKCKHCNGRGYLSVEPESSLTYRCPDCRQGDAE